MYTSCWPKYSLANAKYSNPAIKAQYSRIAGTCREQQYCIYMQNCITIILHMSDIKASKNRDRIYSSACAPLRCIPESDMKVMMESSPRSNPVILQNAILHHCNISPLQYLNQRGSRPARESQNSLILICGHSSEARLSQTESAVCNGQTVYKILYGRMALRY